eukprot:RCo040609
MQLCMPDPRVLQARLRNVTPQPSASPQHSLPPQKPSLPWNAGAYKPQSQPMVIQSEMPEGENFSSPYHHVYNPPTRGVPHSEAEYVPSQQAGYGSPTSSAESRPHREHEGTPSVAGSELLRRQKQPGDLTNQELFIQKQERKIQELLAETKNLKRQLARAHGAGRSTPTPLPKAEDDIPMDPREAQLLALQKRLRAAEKENRLLRSERGSGSDCSLTPKRDLARSSAPRRRPVSRPPEERPPWVSPEVGAMAVSRGFGEPPAPPTRDPGAGRSRSKYAHG